MNAASERDRQLSELQRKYDTDAILHRHRVGFLIPHGIFRYNVIPFFVHCIRSSCPPHPQDMAERKKGAAHAREVHGLIRGIA